MANDVGGLQLADVKAQAQPIPTLRPVTTKLRDGDFRRRWSSYKTVAMTLEAVIARHRAIRSVRDKNGISPEALVVIDGCCPDDVLENLWARKGQPGLYDLFAKEGPCVVVAPDMSVYSREMPACHKLYQIRRSFVMYERYQTHGLVAVPFLAPDCRAHASHYAGWLRANRCVAHVAASFQTFGGNEVRWQRHMRHLRVIRREAGRDLAWLIIGANERFRTTFEERLGSVRLVTAEPKFRRLKEERQQQRPKERSLWGDDGQSWNDVGCLVE